MVGGRVVVGALVVVGLVVRGGDVVVVRGADVVGGGGGDGVEAPAGKQIERPGVSIESDVASLTSSSDDNDTPAASAIRIQ